MNKLLTNVHPQWQGILKIAFDHMDQNYLNSLEAHPDYLPSYEKILAVFTQPLDSIRYILLGESPYPRPQSANGYAFWDEAVGSLWSDSGLSKQVNRATSLRNILKMLLLARGDLSADNLSQLAIAQLDKTNYYATANEFFTGLIDKGFLLLNASLIYSPNEVNYHAKQWQPFMSYLFNQLRLHNKALTMILFGRIAAQIPDVSDFRCLKAEHPYNLSFITNPDVLAFFKPLNLLERHA